MSDIANQTAIANAEIVVNQARATLTAATAREAELQSQIDALTAKLAPAAATAPAPATAPASPAPEPTMAELLKAFNASRSADRNTLRLEALRAAGVAPGALTDAQLIAITPDVDPRTPEGATALASFKQANPGLFAAAADAEFQALSDSLGPERPGSIFSKDKILANRANFNFSESVTVPKAFDVESARAAVMARPNSLFKNGAALADRLLGPAPIKPTL